MKYRLPTDRQLEAYHHVKIMRETYAEVGKKMGISATAVYRLIQRLALTVNNAPQVVETERLKRLLLNGTR